MKKGNVRDLKRKMKYEYHYSNLEHVLIIPIDI